VSSGPIAPVGAAHNTSATTSFAKTGAPTASSTSRWTRARPGAV